MQKVRAKLDDYVLVIRYVGGEHKVHRHLTMADMLELIGQLDKDQFESFLTIREHPNVR